MFKLILNNLKRNYFINILLIVIFTIIMIGISILFNNYLNTNRLNKYLNSYLDIENLYVLRQEINSEDIAAYDKKEAEINKNSDYYIHYGGEIEKNITKNLNHFNIDKITSYFTITCEINKVANNPKFDYSGTISGFITIPEVPNGAIFIDEIFATNIEYPIDEGRDFIKEDFSSNQNIDYFPILAGYDFKEYFKVGDKVDFSMYDAPIDNPPDYGIKNYQGKIIGFLEKNTQVLEDYSFFKLIEADNKLIIGYNPYNISSYLLSLDSINILGEGSFISTNSPKGVEDKILEYTKEDGYEGVSSFLVVKNPNTHYQDLLSMIETSSNSYVIVVGVGIILSLFISGLATFLIIKKNKYTFGIFMMCGGRKKHILIQMMLEFLLVLITSLLFTIIYIFRFIGMEYLFLIPLFIYILVIMLIVLVSITLILRDKKIVDFFKKSEKE